MFEVLKTCKASYTPYHIRKENILCFMSWCQLDNKRHIFYITPTTHGDMSSLVPCSNNWINHDIWQLQSPHRSHMVHMWFAIFQMPIMKIKPIQLKHNYILLVKKI
jgi:hypothetical protein